MFRRLSRKSRPLQLAFVEARARGQSPFAMEAEGQGSAEARAAARIFSQDKDTQIAIDLQAADGHPGPPRAGTEGGDHGWSVAAGQDLIEIALGRAGPDQGGQTTASQRLFLGRFQIGAGSVSYTHLTLPTIYPV